MDCTSSSSCIPSKAIYVTRLTIPVCPLCKQKKQFLRCSELLQPGQFLSVQLKDPGASAAWTGAEGRRQMGALRGDSVAMMTSHGVYPVFYVNILALAHVLDAFPLKA